MEPVEQSVTDPASVAFARIVNDCQSCRWIMEPPVLLRGVHAHRVPELAEELE